MRSSIDALSRAAGTDDGDWSLLHVRDNLVFATATRVAKMARHPDGRNRLANGLETALSAHAHGVQVVTPLVDHLIETDDGPVSLWPRITHVGLDSPGLSTICAQGIGAALALLSQLAPGPPSAWDPFARVPHRLATSTAPRELRERAGAVVTAVAAATPAFDPAEFVFAHGDISIGNVLGTPDHRVWLIDLDSAGPRPCGWDLACLDVDLRLEAGNDKAMVAVREGWRAESELPVSPCGLALIKATMATTFALTLDPTPDRCQAIDARLSAVLIWAQDGAAPARLATFD